MSLNPGTLKKLFVKRSVSPEAVTMPGTEDPKAVEAGRISVSSRKSSVYTSQTARSTVPPGSTGPFARQVSPAADTGSPGLCGFMESKPRPSGLRVSWPNAIRSSRPRTFSDAVLKLPVPIESGCRISPLFGPKKAGSIWPWSWIFTPGELSVGPCGRICEKNS